MNLWRYQLERTGKTKRSISSRLGHYRVDRRRSGKATATQPLAPNLFHLKFSLLSAWPVSEARVTEKKHSGFFAAVEPYRSLYAGTSTSTASVSQFSVVAADRGVQKDAPAAASSKVHSSRQLRCAALLYLSRLRCLFGQEKAFTFEARPVPFDRRRRPSDS